MCVAFVWSESVRALEVIERIREVESEALRDVEARAGPRAPLDTLGDVVDDELAQVRGAHFAAVLCACEEAPELSLEDYRERGIEQSLGARALHRHAGDDP